MVIVAIGTGIRRGDLFNLTWERIDFQRGLIDVPNSKTGRDYSVPMNEDVKAVLQEIRHPTRGLALEDALNFRIDIRRTRPAIAGSSNGSSPE